METGIVKILKGLSEEGIAFFDKLNYMDNHIANKFYVKANGMVDGINGYDGVPLFTINYNSDLNTGELIYDKNGVEGNIIIPLRTHYDNHFAEFLIKGDTAKYHNSLLERCGINLGGGFKKYYEGGEFPIEMITENLIKLTKDQLDTLLDL